MADTQLFPCIAVSIYTFMEQLYQEKNRPISDISLPSAKCQHSALHCPPPVQYRHAAPRLLGGGVGYPPPPGQMAADTGPAGRLAVRRDTGDRAAWNRRGGGYHTDGTGGKGQGKR